MSGNNQFIGIFDYMSSNWVFKWMTLKKWLLLFVGGIQNQSHLLRDIKQNKKKTTLRTT